MAGSQNSSSRSKAAALLGLVFILAGCGSSGAKSALTSTTVSPSSEATSGIGSLASTTQAPTTIPASTSSSTAAVGRSLPVSVQSDAAMVAAGNHGPTSSILVPASCTVTSTTASATGTFQGGFVPEVYHRYGDVIDLYVFSQPQSGYPQGIEVAALSREQSPQIGGSGSWIVTVPVESSPEPATCVVTAQPTHDFEGAPSAY